MDGPLTNQASPTNGYTDQLYEHFLVTDYCVNVVCQECSSTTPVMEIRADDTDLILVKPAITMKVDKVAVGNCVSVTDGVLFMLALYWVFDIKLPPQLKKTFSFLSGHVFQLLPFKHTSATQKILNNIYK